MKTFKLQETLKNDIVTYIRNSHSTFKVDMVLNLLASINSLEETKEEKSSEETPQE